MMLATRTLIGLTAATLAGCGRNHREQPAPAVAATSTAVVSDSLVGIVIEVGSDPTTWLSLTPADGGRARRLTGDSSHALRSVSGAVVWVGGERRDREFLVHAFEVRSVNGEPVDDGIVRLAGTGFEIVMRSGERRVVPSYLERSVGSRVWISRSIIGRAPSYGVIRVP